MPDFAPSVTRLIDELKRLPGIGQKTAQRLAFYLLRVDPEQAFALSDAIRDAKEKVRECSMQQHHGRGPLPILYGAFAQQENHLRGGRSDEHSGSGEDARLRRALSRVGRGAFAVARDWARPAEDQEPDRAIEGRNCGRDYCGYFSYGGGRGDGGLFVEADQAFGRARDADCYGHSGGIGFGICG
jgi:hypothetical protein